MILLKDQSMTLFRSALYETNSVVIHTKDFVLIVDPCWLPHEVKEIRQYVDSIVEGRPLYLLFTHSDYDHIIGYKAFPEAKVIASKAFAEKSAVDKNKIVEEIKAFDDEYYLVRDYEITYPHVDISIKEDGDTLSIGDTKFVFYLSPGHNSDGIFTIVEPLGLFLAGDYLSKVEFPYIYHCSYKYEESVVKLGTILENHDIKMLISGHGEVTEDIMEMERLKLESLEYIHNMREFVGKKDQKAIDQLIEGCQFPRNMKKFHANNQILFEEEARKAEGARLSTTSISQDG